MSSFATQFLLSPDLNPGRSFHDTTEISGLSINSQHLKPGDLFFAIKGARFDSNSIIEEVLTRGAAAVVTDDPTTVERFPEKTILVSDVRRSISRAAHRFFGEPSSKLRCFGVTGTNGKTSVAWALQHALASLGEKTAYIGTLGYCFDAGESITQLDNTAPEPLLLHSILRDAVNAGCRNAVIEATSWGIVQSRTADIQWDCCAFTNLTHDHLDLHGTMENYEAAKGRLFSDELARSNKSAKFAVFNADDPAGVRYLNRLINEQPTIRRSTFGWGSSAIVRVLSADYAIDRTRIVFGIDGLGELCLDTQLIGSYNVMNLAAALSSLLRIGIKPDLAIGALARVPSVPGRMERIVKNGRCVVIDYAHTPDALEKLHLACREITAGRLITVFGAGGDRDRGKRPVMGSIAARFADICVVTSDNPRTEDPEKIVADILAGTGSQGSGPAKQVEVQVDRRKAIHLAIQLAKPGDIVIIAGKGHEDYQIIGTTKTPFADGQVALEALSSL